MARHRRGPFYDCPIAEFKRTAANGYETNQ